MMKNKDTTHRLIPKVRLLTGIDGYPERVPYGPSENYPEFRNCAWAQRTLSENKVYSAVRHILFGMGLDSRHFETSDWNPLGDLTHRGGRVTIKPNMVRHWNENKNDSWQTVVTHWAVVRALIDYALLAVGPRGSVTVGDASHWDCNMEKLKDLIDVPTFLHHYDETVPGQVNVVDFRPEFFHASGVAKCEPCPLPGDPSGYVLVDLRGDSMFAEPCLNPNLFYGSGYDNRSTVRAHSQGRHEYLIAGSALDCDLFINVPKLKTHHLLGLTVAMKNLVGINGDKNFLPHFRLGFSDHGGDQYPRRTPSLVIRYWILKCVIPVLARSYFATRLWGQILGMFHKAGGKNPYAGGGWIGNDTVWRMTLDLNRILLYAQKDGALCRGERARQYLTVVDGIVGGEGEGPMNVRSNTTGILIAASDPLICDMVAARIMGFDLEHLRLISEGLKDHAFPISNVKQTEDIDYASCVISKSPQWEATRWENIPNYNYIPPTGWEDIAEGQRERER